MCFELKTYLSTVCGDKDFQINPDADIIDDGGVLLLLCTLQSEERREYNIMFAYYK